MPQLPLTDILFAGAVLLIPGILIMHKKNKKLSLKEIIIIVSGGVIFTFISLFVQAKGWSGTGMRTLRGWPHFFYFSWYANEGAGINAFSVGPIGSYVLADIFFYSSIIFSLTKLKKN